jgi:hypothetical protein
MQTINYDKIIGRKSLLMGTGLKYMVDLVLRLARSIISLRIGQMYNDLVQNVRVLLFIFGSKMVEVG